MRHLNDYVISDGLKLQRKSSGLLRGFLLNDLDNMEMIL